MSLSEVRKLTPLQIYVLLEWLYQFFDKSRKVRRI
jgi:hypothetical protein